MARATPKEQLFSRPGEATGEPGKELAVRQPNAVTAVVGGPLRQVGRHTGAVFTAPVVGLARRKIPLLNVSILPDREQARQEMTEDQDQWRGLVDRSEERLAQLRRPDRLFRRGRQILRGEGEDDLFRHVMERVVPTREQGGLVEGEDPTPSEVRLAHDALAEARRGVDPLQWTEQAINAAYTGCVRQVAAQEVDRTEGHVLNLLLDGLPREDRDGKPIKRRGEVPTEVPILTIPRRHGIVPLALLGAGVKKDQADRPSQRGEGSGATDEFWSAGAHVYVDKKGQLVVRIGQEDRVIAPIADVVLGENEPDVFETLTTIVDKTTPITVRPPTRVLKRLARRFFGSDDLLYAWVNRTVRGEVPEPGSVFIHGKGVEIGETVPVADLDAAQAGIRDGLETYKRVLGRVGKLQELPHTDPSLPPQRFRAGIRQGFVDAAYQVPRFTATTRVIQAIAGAAGETTSRDEARRVDRQAGTASERTISPGQRRVDPNFRAAAEFLLMADDQVAQKLVAAGRADLTPEAAKKAAAGKFLADHENRRALEARLDDESGGREVYAKLLGRATDLA